MRFDGFFGTGRPTAPSLAIPAWPEAEARLPDGNEARDWHQYPHRLGSLRPGWRVDGIAGDHRQPGDRDPGSIGAILFPYSRGHDASRRRAVDRPRKEQGR